jgi:UDP-N-acetylmuramate--alanine ligase
VGIELDLSTDQIREGLEHFHGADRRFQIKAEPNGITVVDDYGHHPAEIRVTLEAARLFAGPEARIWAVFQPHRYTRTRSLMDDFARCFEGCEQVWVLDIYAASETPIPGISSERLVARMRELGFERARYAASEHQAINEILAEARPGDLIMTIGAGSVWKVGETLVSRLQQKAEQIEVARE